MNGECPIEPKSLVQQARDFVECPQKNLSEKDLLAMILAVLVESLPPDDYGPGE